MTLTNIIVFTGSTLMTLELTSALEHNKPCYINFV